MALALGTPYAAIAADAASTVQEVVVTAQKREEKLQDVPAAVSAVSDAMITAVGATRLTDLTAYVPNVNLYGNTKTQEIRIRGVGASAANIGFDARVGLYIDGVYSGTSGAVDQELVDVERIEILRGPQGAFFGQNTVAGAINIITKKPSDTFEGQLLARGGNFDAWQVAGRASGPLAAGLDGLVSINHDAREGYILNTSNGTREDSRNVTTWRAGLRYTGIDKLDVSLTLDALHAREADNHGQLDAFGFVFLNATPDRISTNTPSRDKRDNFGATLDTQYQLGGGLSARAIVGYRQTRATSVYDADFTKLDINTIFYGDDYHTLSEEIQVLSPPTGKLTWMLGGYHAFTFANSDRFQTVGADGGIANEVPGTVTPNIGKTNSEVWGLFGNLTYAITDQWSLNLGGRISQDGKKLNWIKIFNLPPTRQSISTSDVSPTATLNYKPTPNLLAYLRYAEGYKSPGFNVDYIDTSTYPNHISFAKEKAHNYELGVKDEAFDGRLTANLAVFYTVYNQFQFEQLLPGGGLGIGNAAEVVSKGVEIETVTRPIPGLSISANAGFLSARFTKDIDGFGVFGITGGKGNYLVRAPKFQGAILVDYTHPVMSTYVGKAHVGFTYEAKSFDTVDNFTSFGTGIPGGILPAVGLLDARFAVASQDSRWEFALWGRNLTDRIYKNQDSVSSLGAYGFGVQYAPPRTYGAELRVMF